MARKPNYDFEKRRKEQDRKAKTDAKRLEREQRRDERRNESVPEGQETDGSTTPPPTE